MIITENFYAVQCNVCEEIAGNHEYDNALLPDESSAKDNAMEEEWICHGDKHYCQDCYSYDDADNFIFKTKYDENIKKSSD